MKFLQLNLGREKEAQNLLMQTAKERGDDVLLISEQHKWSENSAWYQDASRTAGILVCSPDLSIRDFLETEAGFVWVASERLVAGPLSRATVKTSCGNQAQR